MTTDQALLKIAAPAAEAVGEALRPLCRDEIAPGVARVVPEGAAPLADLGVPAVVTRVAYADGVAGANLLAMPVDGARRLAAAMTGAEPRAGQAGDLDEAELAAVGDAMNQALSAAAHAVGRALGQAIEVTPHETRLISAAGAADDLLDGLGTHVACVELTVMGAPCRLVQAVAPAFVARVARTPDDALAGNGGEPLKAALQDIPVRVWVELGRARMPMGRLVALPVGEVVELDRDVHDPVDLYVDGMHVARGRLVVSDDGGSLSLDIESITTPAAPGAA